ncbi:hypothetical protein REPUB_Repub09cG0040600 [Reevesia pubescens]
MFTTEFYNKWQDTNTQEKTTHPYLAPSIHNAIKTVDNSKLHEQQIQVDEFQERPGKLECPYFMKIGYCKYKTACKFNHPKTRHSRPPTAFIFSSAGLPLRPANYVGDDKAWDYNSRSSDHSSRDKD